MSQIPTPQPVVTPQLAHAVKVVREESCTQRKEQAEFPKNQLCHLLLQRYSMMVKMTMVMTSIPDPQEEEDLVIVESEDETYIASFPRGMSPARRHLQLDAEKVV